MQTFHIERFRFDARGSGPRGADTRDFRIDQSRDNGSTVGKRSVVIRREVPCSPCLKKTCPTDFRCMTLIGTDDVLAAARDMLEAPMKKKAVFLDRDGTINVEVGYLDRIDKLVILPGAFEAVRLINRAGMLAVIITNQAGIARDSSMNVSCRTSIGRSPVYSGSKGLSSTIFITAPIIPRRDGIPTFRPAAAASRSRGC